MSLMGDVQKFIESHPGCTSSDIANAFADFPRKSVLQSTSKLRQCGRIAHRFEGKTRRHFALETDIQPDQEPDRSTFLMSKKQLPAAPAGRPCARVTCETLPSALDRWNGGIKAAATDDNSISVFDVIGQDYWGEGVTAKRIAGALRVMNGADVTVNINSPGGDMFEGLAIYNLLREYQGKVTVKVLGIAASAASVIAMAGDDIQIGRGAFLMIHNCWVATV